MKERKNKSAGVTLVGVLIGVTILSVALVSQIRLLSSTIKRESDLRNIITATNLAREGVELAFSKRITQGWSGIKDDQSLFDKDFCMDINNIANNSVAATGDPCFQKKLNFVGNGLQRNFIYEDSEENGKYTTPPYWRTMKFESCNDPNFTDEECINIVSLAGWGAESEETKKVTLKKRIYNWYVP